MKKNILLAFGVFCLFACKPLSDAKAIEQGSEILAYGPRFELQADSPFVYLKRFGFSVSAPDPYLVFNYQQDYYLLNEGQWYFSDDLSGPWTQISKTVLPPSIAKHDLKEIRKHMDIEKGNLNSSYSHAGSDLEQQREMSTF
jgi:hypothetical protein